MANQKLTKEYWEKKDELIQAAVRGWNPIQRIPVLLREAYADLKGIDFGFFVEADIPERMSMGWEFLSKDMFDADELNSVLPARYGIEEVGGRFKWQNNYLMIMGKDFRKRLIAARNQAHEDKYQASVSGRAYTSPHDPRQEEMKEHAVSKLESHQVRPTTQETPKRGPGRPPKN